MRAAAELLRQSIQPPANQPLPKNPDEQAGQTPAPTPEAPAAETPAPVDPSAPAAETPETPAETPPAPETPETPAPAKGEGEEDPDGGESPTEVTPLKADRIRLRVAKDDEVGRLAAAYKARNQDWTLEQAIDAAKTKLGLNKPTDPAAPPAPKSDLPESIEAVDAEIRKIFADKATAADELRLGDMNKLDERLWKLRDHREGLKQEAARNEIAQARHYQRDFEASEKRAAEMYEFMAQPDSPAGKRAAEIDEAFRATGDERYDAPDKPELIAKIVAREMGLAPKSKLPAPAPKAAAPAAPAPKKQVLPAGGGRTAPVAPAPNAIDAKITGVRTLSELKALNRELGIPS